jgi:DNA-binding MarR family transcriptional regulator
MTKPPADELKVLPHVTEKQAKCLRFIYEYFLEHRYYPTQREVAKAMEVRSSTAEMFIKPLEDKGYLSRERGDDDRRKQRNIRLTPDALERLRLMGVEVGGKTAAA